MSSTTNKGFLKRVVPCRVVAQRGSAMVEFSLMLPLFLLVIQGLMFFGGVGLVEVDMARLSALGIQVPGSQSADHMPSSYLSLFSVSEAIDSDSVTIKDEVVNEGSLIVDGLYSAASFNPAVWEVFQDSYENGTFDANASIPDSEGTPDDPYDVFDSLVDGAFSATGNYILENGEIRYEVSLQASAYGEYILNNDLVYELEKIAAVFDGWFQEEKTEVEFSYNLSLFAEDDNDVAASSIVQNSLSLVRLGLDRGIYYPGEDLTSVDSNKIGQSVFDAVEYDGRDIFLLDFSEKMREEWQYGDIAAYMFSYSAFKFPQSDNNLATDFRFDGQTFTVANGEIDDD